MLFILPIFTKIQKLLIFEIILCLAGDKKSKLSQFYNVIQISVIWLSSSQFSLKLKQSSILGLNQA